MWQISRYEQSGCLTPWRCCALISFLPFNVQYGLQIPDVPHREWGCASPGMHILTGTGDVPHREWISSPGMHILTGNGNVPHREWECASPGMGMCLTGNGNVPHREWECASPGMGMRKVCTISFERPEASPERLQSQCNYRPFTTEQHLDGTFSETKLRPNLPKRNRQW